MSEQELLLKTNDELAALADDLVVKIKMLNTSEKSILQRSQYFEDLQTIMKIKGQRVE